MTLQPLFAHPLALRSAPRSTALTAVLGLAAGAIPSLLAFSVPPMASLFNEVLAFLCWGLLVAQVGRCARFTVFSLADGRAVIWAMVVIATAAWLPPLRDHSPIGCALITCGFMAAAFVVFRLGTQLGPTAGIDAVFGGLCVGVVLAGLANAAIAIVQVYFPGLADSQIIPMLRISGRAVGTLRQPNQTAAIFVWALLALGYLLGTGRIRAKAAWLIAALVCTGASLTASRTGQLNIALITLWALLDKRLPKDVRRLFVGLLALALVAAVLITVVGADVGSESGLATRFDHASTVASRWLILRDTLALIAAHPWLGTGWGEFNFVWTLTPRSWQTVHHVSTSHNLPLEFVAELGLPIGLAVIGLLATGLWRAAWACLSADDPAALLTRKCALAMVVAMVVYSQFEYPLWYAYFLLPTAFFLGVAIARPGGRVEQSITEQNRSPPRPMVAAGLLVALAGVFGLYDSMKVVQIFVPPTIPLPANLRIAQGQGSVLFKPFADYAAATFNPKVAPEVYYSAAHSILDERLLRAWADDLHARGDDDRARFLIQRALMFKSPLVDELAAQCPPSLGPKAAFPCGLPQRQLRAEDFRP